MSISAWYLLKGRHGEFAKRSFTGGLLLATIAVPAQLISGDWQAKIVAQYQPAKLAAMEGRFQTEANAPLYLWGWPNEATGRVEYGLGIPGLLSLLVHGDASKPVAGIDELKPRWGCPPVGLTFQSYHLMVAIGILFIVSDDLCLAPLLARNVIYETLAALVFRGCGRVGLYGKRGGMGCG